MNSSLLDIFYYSIFGAALLLSVMGVWFTAIIPGLDRWSKPMSMYGFILSDQIEQDRRQQQELAQQRANVMVLQMRPHFIYNTLMSI